MDIRTLNTVTISLFQQFLDQRSINLAVGPIKDEDYKSICFTSAAELNWEHALTDLGNRNERFEVCFKDPESMTVVGVVLGLYNAEHDHLELHYAESFVRSDSDHPLAGRLVALSVVAAFFFVKAIEAQELHLVDPTCQALWQYYERMGFVPSAGCASHGDNCLSASAEQLEQIFVEMAKRCTR